MDSFRTFIVDPAGTCVAATHEEWLRHMGVSVELSAAYDVLEAGLDREPPESWVKMLVVAEKDGRDPEAFARHLLKLHSAAVDFGREKRRP